MMGRVMRWLVGSRLARDQSGMALTILLAFMVLAVPLTVASLQVASQFSRSSQTYNQLLTGEYSSSCGMEISFWQLLNDPAFDTGLTQASPTRQLSLSCNSQPVTVNVTKIFSGAPLTGQGMKITKAVVPTSTTPSLPTTYTYTITIENVGTGTNQITRVQDLLPKGFTYVTGSTTGLTTANPTIVDQADTVDPLMLWLNNAAANPLPWSSTQGAASISGSITPPQSTWTVLPEYWEVPLVAGQFSNSNWEHWQWWNTADGNNRYRWKVQRVQGAVVTDLFTAPDTVITPSGAWTLKNTNTNPGAITVAAGDSFRLRLEVFSSQSSASSRLFQYRWGGATNYDSRSKVPSFTQSNCSGNAQQLTWTITPDLPIAAGAAVTMSLQATATKPDGTYYNTASVRYRPWWDLGTQVDGNTPPTAPITVGSGQPSCGGGLVVTKSVVPPDAPAGVQTTFTYTISIQNQTPFSVPIKEIHDLLPPTFTFVTGSSGGFWPFAPNTVTLDGATQRWHIIWDVNANARVGANSTVTQTFQAQATPVQGVDYNNDAWVEWDGDFCVSCPPGNGTSSTGSSATVIMPRLYDLQAVSGSGTIQSRVQLSLVGNQLTVLSWQEF